MPVTAESLEDQFANEGGGEGYDFNRLELQEWIDAVMDELESLPDEDRVDYLSALQEVDPDGWAMIVHEGWGMRDENRPEEPPTETQPYQPPPWDPDRPAGPPVTGPLAPDDEVNTLPLTPVPTPGGPPGTDITPPPPFSPEEIHDPTGPGTVTVPPPFSPEEIRDPGGPGTVTVPEPPDQGWFPDILGEGMTPPSHTPGTGPDRTDSNTAVSTRGRIPVQPGVHELVGAADATQIVVHRFQPGHPAATGTVEEVLNGPDASGSLMWLLSRRI